jgi:hypothetical protein
MDLEERIVAGVLGAIWGSVLGFLFALLVSYQTQRFYSSGFLRSDWVSTVSGFAVFFGVIGLLLKASAGTLIGWLMNWVWAIITRDHERGLLFYESAWVKVVAFFILVAVVYWIMKVL